VTGRGAAASFEKDADHAGAAFDFILGGSCGYTDACASRDSRTSRSRECADELDSGAHGAVIVVAGMTNAGSQPNPALPVAGVSTSNPDDLAVLPVEYHHRLNTVGQITENAVASRHEIFIRQMDVSVISIGVVRDAQWATVSAAFRAADLALPRLLSWCSFRVDDVVAESDALVADVDARPCDEPFDLGPQLPAERAPR
jgi:hypothetical protein